MPYLNRSFLAFLLIWLSLAGSGCWSQLEPDNYAYILAVGVDQGEENRLKITYLIANSKEMGREGGDAGQKSLVTSVESPSVFATLNMVNTYVGRRLTLMHAKIIIFSEEAARSGLMGSFVAAIGQYREVRGTMFIGVTKGTAADRIADILPILETNPAKYIELIAGSGITTGFTPQAEHFDTMYIALSADGIEPVTMLFGPSREPGEASRGGDTAGEREMNGGGEGERTAADEFRPEGDYTAGTLPREGGVDFGAMGAVAFRGPVMVGEMTGDETMAWGMINGKFRQSIISLPDPLAEGAVLSAAVSEGRKPRIRVSLVDGKPRIDVKITLEGNVLGIQSLIDYQQPDKQSVLEEAYKRKIEKMLNKIIERSQKEFRSDIFGFGLYARRHFLTLDAWKQVRWEELYPEAEISLTVEFKIRHTGMFIRIAPIVDPAAGVEEGDNE